MNIHDITKQIRAFADQLDAAKAPEQPADYDDPYAELKAAHAAGKVIQAMNFEGEWRDMHYPPLWNLSLSKYRIKPDDSPPWIEHKGGPCPLRDDGVEEFEFKIRTGKASGPSTSPSVWRWTHEGNHGDIIAYRVLKARPPAPKQPLGPEDVPPFSLIRRKPEQDNGQQWHWRCMSYVHGVGIQCGDRGYKWEEMQKDYEINRPRHRDENGNPTLWEACER
jgi:hypothetical protein